MRVLVAPDKFKGTLTAPAAASAIASGWRRADPSADPDEVPLADGGEGTLDALVAAGGGVLHRVAVAGPLGDPIEAEFGILEGRGGAVGVVEMARASGLALLAPERRDPKRTTTRGTGELILAGSRAGARSIVVCIGGSATNDGGAGMAQALGVRLLDQDGRELRPGGAHLVDLARIDARGLDPDVAEATITVATDVTNTLLGPSGASAIYGPQKGATPDDVALLDRALGHFAAVVHRDLGVDVREMPGAGAAGGLGAGLVAFLGARLRPGVRVVMEAVGFDPRLESADVVVTGEGAFDAQSLQGKVVAGVLRSAGDQGIPVVILCGTQEAEAPDAAVIASLAERFGPAEAMAHAPVLLEELAFETAAAFLGARGRTRG